MEYTATDELWDLYDENRQPIDKLHKRGVPLQSGEYHQVVEIITINQDGKMLLTKRDPIKTRPLLWESTGGSVLAGESSLEGAVRELEEETGLSAKSSDLIKLGENRNKACFFDSYIWKSERQIELSDLILQAGEVCDAKFADWEEIVKMNELGLIVPTVWERYRMFEDEIKRKMIG